MDYQLVSDWYNWRLLVACRTFGPVLMHNVRWIARQRAQSISR